MTEQLRWGILATGGIAHEMVKDLLLAGHRVTAVGSRSAESAAAFAAEYDIPNAHGSYDELVNDPEVDIVYVASPHPFHREHGMLALAAGKHALIEKSFTVNAAEARELVDFAAEHDLVVLEAMWTRWLPHMVRIREIIAAGTLGDVHLVLADHTQKLPSDPSHRVQDLALGGGALLDLGIYPVSFAWDVLGAPTSIVAASSPTPTGADRQTGIIFGYADGAQAVLHCELDAAGPNVASIIGTEARVDIDRVWYTPTTFRVVATDGTVLETWQNEVEGRGMQYQAAAIEALVASGATAGAELPPQETVAIMAALDDIRAQIGLRYPSEH